MGMNYNNPVIRGFNPDPSICRVGADFYLVTSSFEYFPGVPIYHSRNLVNWECIGHCLTRKSQLDLSDASASGGIFAPTLRYHNGRFYMITTNVETGNFIVWTDDIYGEWSDPIPLVQGGIDPSLTFADGKTYVTTNTSSKGEQGIHLSEIDIDTGEITSPERRISGACIGRFPEGPHLYKIGGKYYLLLAEGGTEYQHMATIQMADEPYGPYIPCPHNPILSHRFAEDMTIACTGHADIIDDENGGWWLVSLGVRTLSDEKRYAMLHNLGRETFLAPVRWEQDGGVNWPVAGDGGRYRLTMNADLPEENKGQEPYVLNTSFSEAKPGNDFEYIREYDPECYLHDPAKGTLTVRGRGISLSKDKGKPSFIGIRQTDFVMKAEVYAECAGSGPAIGGITVFYNNEQHYDLVLKKDGGGTYVFLRKQIYDENVAGKEETAEAGGKVRLTVTADRYRYSFYCNGRLIGSGTTTVMCSEAAQRNSFTGTFIGLFAEQGDVRFSRFSVTPCSGS